MVWSFLQKQESSFLSGFWTPAFAGVTYFFSSLSELSAHHYDLFNEFLRHDTSLWQKSVNTNQRRL